MKGQAFAALVVSFLVAVPLTSWGLAGDLDPSFGNGGIVIQDDVHGGITALARQSDGKLIAAGSSLARYNDDGSLDAAFGGGVTPLIWNGAYGWASALVLEPDGQIVVAGGISIDDNGDTDFALARYNSDGSLDTDFGSGGVATNSFSAVGSDYLYNIALQPDGKLVVSGTAMPDPDHSSYVLARFNADGTLDPSFSGNGWLKKQIADYGSTGGVAVLPDGKILLSGTACNQDACWPVLLRYTAAGTPDPSFGTGGVVQMTQMNASFGPMLVRSDAKIILAGRVAVPQFKDIYMAVVRLNPDASLDTAFGNGGIALALGNRSGARALVQRADGSLVVGGIAGWTFDDFVLARFTEAGVLDDQFGRQGLVITDLPGQREMLSALAVQTDDTVVAAGTASREDGSPVWALARYADGDCGNGIIERGEECDDGNLVSGDGCDANCTVTRCGNGIVTAGEECDDGNQDNHDACKNDCTLNVCGDGVVRTGVEICDDGNAVDDDGCSNTCQRTLCGDGIKQPSEECDDGNTVSGDGCDANCYIEECGNGRVEDNEQCDDGGPSSRCGADCRWTVVWDAVLAPWKPTLPIKLRDGQDELTLWVPVRTGARPGWTPPGTRPSWAPPEGHVLELIASDGDCPAGTVVYPAGPIFFVRGRIAQLPIHITRAAFPDASSTVPQHCTLTATARIEPEDVFDPNPQNNTITMGLDVYVSGTTSSSAFTLGSVGPVSATIARGKTAATKSVGVKVSTRSPDPTKQVTITVQDGSCPAGTVGAPTASSVALKRKSQGVPLPLTIQHGAFKSLKNSPARCTAVVTATASTFSAKSQTVKFDIDVTDLNDK